jgi:hypothetical protein
LKRLSGLLIALSVSACSSIPPFPTTKLIEYDSVTGVCGEYKIVDMENFKFEYVADIQCPSVFGFTVQDTPLVLNYLEDMRDLAKQRCR